MDYIENCCPLNTSKYGGTPDAAPTTASLDVKGLLAEYDALLSKNGEAAAADFLNTLLARAEQAGDWRAELSFVNEWLGLSRRLGDEAAGMKAVSRAKELAESHGLGRTVSGATVLLNAATTLNCFGRSGEALPLFTHVCRVYGDNLSSEDYRFAGLYNNMANCYAALEDGENARRHFLLALKTLESCPGSYNERAVTLCSLADIAYERDALSSEVNEYMELAWQNLSHPDNKKDGYFRFNAEKCLPAFDKYGFFVYALQLRKYINEGT